MQLIYKFYFLLQNVKIKHEKNPSRFADRKGLSKNKTKFFNFLIS